ncbi:alpha/beta hydrolase [Leptospira yasudae]|uniref:Alpha/beta fold hydrolase n=1 Tax=Leptospira yasudae TaxID=2202201 RepID=A0A5F2BP92_9LEPT|nr:MULTISPECIES: alpha/beta fold hydrolase [Leptospira]MBW0432871.1 alpha/beta fold hydrolase [Leptospira yasudae]MCG6169471.1 alpha/beta hydrolase [Leptospira sanjuanensis]MCG6194872.1 alpha/beta hydrolase [Leptospira sanjuanensis]RHX96179.1 alpha/beta hydrolase [Leptospira yasudae]TGK29996.1 alpha/beta fold hydrolase [Leptospira yasudae]
MNAKIRRTFWILFLGIFLSQCKASIQLQGEMHHPKTEDGWDLTLEHFPPLAGHPPKKYPVILCHGLIANRTYLKINEKSSIVGRLQKEGYDVWLLDLRGRRDAGYPSLFFGDKTFSYSMDDYIRYDVDAAIKHVLNATGKDKVNWVGHSMGGMIIYSRIGSLGEKRIANFVAIGSPAIMDPPNSALKRWTSLTWLMNLWPVVPAETWAGIQGGTGIPFLPQKSFEELFWHKPNIESSILSDVKTTSINPGAKNEILQFKDLAESGEIRSLDHKISYSNGLKNIKIPTLLIAGRRDKLGMSYSLRYAYDNIGSEDKTLFIASRSNNHSDDYGHTDLIVGKNADRDVFVPLVAWLDKRN